MVGLVSNESGGAKNVCRGNGNISSDISSDGD